MPEPTFDKNVSAKQIQRDRQQGSMIRKLYLHIIISSYQFLLQQYVLYFEKNRIMSMFVPVERDSRIAEYRINLFKNLKTILRYYFLFFLCE